MTEAMHVNSRGLRDAGPAFETLSSSVDTTLRRLAAALDAEGACWGGDETGVTFAESYVPGADAGRAAFALLRDGMRGVGGAVLAVADNVDAADGRATSRLS